MRVQVLGPVRVWQDGATVDLGPPEQRGVLGLLALARGRAMPRPELVEALWGERPPAGATGRIGSYVSGLRRALEPDRASHRRSAVLPLTGDGYALQVPEAAVDALVFRSLINAAAQQRRDGEAARAAGLLADALRLWHGPALADVALLAGHPTVAALSAERDTAVVRYAQALLDAGEPGAALPVLREAAAARPLDEAVHALLIRVCDALGRRVEAVRAFRDIHRRLAAELGVEPGRELAAAYAMLGGEPAAPAALGGEPAAPAWRRPVPAHLPPDVIAFAGRRADLDRLDGLLAGDPPDRTGRVVVAAVSGAAGVGKTALAVHWAHRVASRFPDGQLYVNLRGFDPAGQAMEPAAAVRRFLDALDIPPERIPAELDAQTALYRSALADRRVLILLDNARDSAQVRPLLPAAPTCMVLVTSRNQLTGLIAADGADYLNVGLLSAAEAGELLAGRLGGSRVAAEPDAVAEIVSRCARLPLALAIAAARAATGPHLPLHVFAAQLRDAAERLDRLGSVDDPQTDVALAFSWSYRALTPAAARLFRLLGVHPGPDLTAPAAASLAAVPLAAARTLLSELTHTSMLTEPEAGRYTFHDLLRAYATHLSRTVDPEPDRRAATARILDHYVHTAYAAGRLLLPGRDPITLSPAEPGTVPESLTDRRQALDWFTAEHRVLLAAVDLAVTTGQDGRTRELVWSLTSFLERSGRWPDLVATQRAAVAAARRLNDPTAQAQAHRSIARALIALSRFDDARTHLDVALDLDTAAGDRFAQAHDHHHLGHLCERQGRYAAALDHAYQSLEFFQATDDRLGQAMALNAVGWFRIRLGDHRRALDPCRQALALLQELGDRQGQAATWDSIGYAHHHLGEHAQAGPCFQQAVALYRDLDDRYGEAATLDHLGENFRLGGEPEAARAAWRRAATILADFGLPDAGPVRAKLAALDAPAAGPQPAADPQPAAGSQPSARAAATLTPREWQVAELVSEGLTNREIAGRLFVTEKTVEMHLSRVFTKLGVRNRVGVVRAVQSHR